MHHAITIGGLLAFFAMLVGLALFCVGGMTFFAGSMSDAPEMGDSYGRTGCITALVGIALFAAGIWGLS